MLTNYLIYLRKSRSDSPDLSVEEVLSRHESILQEYSLKNFGETIPETHIYREVVSGETISARPAMQAVMQLIESSNITGVLVVEPQRLSRGDLEDCGRIVNAFRYTYTKIVTPQKTYDLQDEYDRKFFEMELTRGNDYLEYTKKILMRGRIVSVKSGNYIGSVAPYGYRKVTIGIGKDAKHTLEIVPEEADAVRLMYHLYINERYGFSRIALHLDDLGIKPRKSDHWHVATIKDIIENPVYIGKVRWGWRPTQKVLANGEIVKYRPKKKDPAEWILVDGHHTAVIDEKSYNTAMELRGSRPRIKINTETVNPFAGILYCGICGHAMSYKRDTHRNKENPTVSMVCNNQRHCKTRSISYSAFKARLIECMENAIADFEVQLKNDNGNAASLNLSIIHNLEEDLRRLHEKDIRQKDAFDDGIYSKEEYIARNQKVQEQILFKTKAIEKARSSISPIVDYREKISRFSDCVTALRDDSVSAAEKNSFLKSCVSRIDYYTKTESVPGTGRWGKNVFELEIGLN